MRIACLLIAGTLLAGCGGGDISKADFVKKANAICTKGDAALQKATDGLDATDGKDAVLDAIKNKVVPNIQGQIDDIRDLGFPSGDEDRLEGILGKAEDVLGRLKADPESMLGGTDPFADINKGFEDYGLTACGSS